MSRNLIISATTTVPIVHAYFLPVGIFIMPTCVGYTVVTSIFLIIRTMGLVLIAGTWLD